MRIWVNPGVAKAGSGGVFVQTPPPSHRVRPRVSSHRPHDVWEVPWPTPENGAGAASLLPALHT